jgi:hypothetical protein
MTTTTLTANGAIPSIPAVNYGRRWVFRVRGTLGGGTIQIRTTPAGSTTGIVQTYVTADLNSDNTLTNQITIAANTAWDINLTGATSPNVTIDTDILESLRSL